MRNVVHHLSVAAVLLSLTSSLSAADRGLLGRLSEIRTIGSTLPPNGDVNPYGVAIVPVTTGRLVKGDILVSNFNNSGNAQGTGTTIVEIAPNGTLSVFAALTSLPGPCPGGIGLTTALAVLRSGWVIVGSLPTSNGMAATAKAGCLIILDSSGNPVETLSGNGINGPWDMTALDRDTSAVLFVSNVLNDRVVEANGGIVNGGTVLRIVLDTSGPGNPRVSSRSLVGSGFPERTDPNALIIGPTGLALHPNGTLFVADTLGNRIASIQNAVSRSTSGGTGATLFAGTPLNQPLGLAIAPNFDLIAANAGDGNMVEVNQSGQLVSFRNVDVSGQGGGTLFGLAIAQDGSALYYVDDGNNTLDVLLP
jgi:hypothetical protein